MIASHSSCRAISDVPRNMTDEMIRALGRNGGVIGINFGEGFLTPKGAGSLKKSISTISYNDPNLAGKALDEYAAKQYIKQFRSGAKSVATLEDAVAHIERAVKLTGIDHVGVGSDYDGIESAPIGLEDVTKIPALAAALRKRGYSEQDVQKILGGNYLRVLREVTGR